MITEFETTAVYSVNGNCYHHFGIHLSLVSLYGDDPNDIVTLKMKVSDDQTLPINEANTAADYWGWYDNESEEFEMIYAKKFLLEMCFPCGTKPSEDAGQGKACRLEIIKDQTEN